MGPISRRDALYQSTVLTTAAVLPSGRTAVAGHAAPNRRFRIDLNSGAIGVKASLPEAIELASRHGFESVDPNAGFLGSLSETECKEMQATVQEKGLTWGAAGLPVDFRRDDATFRDGLKQLPKLARAMELAGVTRVGTWLKPFHEELTYVGNMRQHAKRLRECVRILGDHGQRFGMEYVGPKTLWASKLHPFIHTMAETKDLIEGIGEDNVGFVLDSWHWYTAHETVDDLRSLKNKDIIACDLNDAPAGLAIDEQIDNQRELPASTGVIDLQAFLGALVDIGYDGPVRAEPFNAKLNALDNDPACAATAAAMKKACALVGG